MVGLYERALHTDHRRNFLTHHIYYIFYLGFCPRWKPLPLQAGRRTEKMVGRIGTTDSRKETEQDRSWVTYSYSLPISRYIHLRVVCLTGEILISLTSNGIASFITWTVISDLLLKNASCVSVAMAWRFDTISWSQSNNLKYGIVQTTWFLQRPGSSVPFGISSRRGKMVDESEKLTNSTIPVKFKAIDSVIMGNVATF